MRFGAWARRTPTCRKMALLNNGDEEMTSRKRRRRVSERAEDDGLTVHELIEGGDGLTYKLDLHTANSENVTKKIHFYKP